MERLSENSRENEKKKDWLGNFPRLFPESIMCIFFNHFYSNVISINFENFLLVSKYTSVDPDGEYLWVLICFL